jgi:cobalt-zinc-cadmium efflux system outer membrane protein
MASARLALLLVAIALSADAESPLSLDESFALAQSANRTIAAARLRLAVDQAGLEVARERPNPELKYEYAKETPHHALTATQPLEIGGRRGRRIELAEAAGRTGEAELARTIAEVRSQVRRAYYGVAASQARLGIAREVEGLAERTRGAAKDRFDAGDVPRLEVLQAELNLAQARNETATIEGERGAARAELNVLIGRAPDAATEVAEDLDAAALPEPEAAARAAQAGNAELSLLDRQMAEAEARAALARAEQVPEPSVEAAVTHDAPGEFDWGWRAAVGIALPIFTRHAGAVHVEEATIAKLRVERDALVQRLQGAVGAALVRATVQRQQYLRYRDEILPRSREVESMAEESYRSGQTGLVALLQAAQAAREARAKGVQAALDYQVALADLERAAAVGPP